MEEKIKIYIRSKNKIYIFFNDEIFFFENQELELVLELFLEENNVEKNTKLSIILHFSYFLFENFDENQELEDKNLEKKSLNLENISEILKKKINFINRKMAINYLENRFLDICLDKREILKLKKCVKKYSLLISELKVDFDAVYNYYKNRSFEISQNEIFENTEDLQNTIENVEDAHKTGIIESVDTDRNFGEIEEIDINEEIEDNHKVFGNGNKFLNKNDRIEIFQLGEENSIRILIKDEKIVELEKVDLKIEDVDDIENFDFGDMIVIGTEENDIKSIFIGEEFSDSLDFMKNKVVFDKENLKSIKISDVIIASIIIVAYFTVYNSIPFEKKITENKIIQKEIKTLEKEYLKKKSEEIPDYSKELATLHEIDEAIKRREYYSVIKFLVENSKNGIDYTKINYENSKWTIQGEIENFNNFERFENNILRKYPSSELGYLKDNDTATVFEYILETF